MVTRASLSDPGAFPGSDDILFQLSFTLEGYLLYLDIGKAPLWKMYKSREVVGHKFWMEVLLFTGRIPWKSCHFKAFG